MTKAFSIMTTATIIAITGLMAGMSVSAFAGENVQKVEANCVAEIECVSEKTYRNPFTELELDAIVTGPGGAKIRVPAFWAGGDRWRFRYASSMPGVYTWKLDCSDRSNSKLHGMAGKIEVVRYQGTNVLYRHGPIRVARDKRHFEHADGTPFLWLADTWWKNLCKRMTWKGFQELTADRKAKGFNAVQIVCGPYPDENMMEECWGNEGGKPYEKKDFSVVNPKYFDYADRRIKHLVDAGIVPVIVGGWGRPQAGGKSTLQQVGLDGFKRHWRNLVARYGAYPTVWIVGGEAKDAYGPWTTLAKYLKDVDPYRRPVVYHAPGHPRQALKDNAVFDFDMVAIGHRGYDTAAKSLELIKSCLSQDPARPVLCGEASYEGHMQTNFQDVQRYMFWSFMLSGAAGHTYGAAGIWHASVEGDPGIDPIYDWTTWKEGMKYPGSTQLGLGKKLLEQYPWSRLEPHPEWAEKDCFAAGIPGELRFIYQPKRGIYNWRGAVVKNVEPNVAYSAFYFDPASGRRFDLSAMINGNRPRRKPFEGHAKPRLFEDRFEGTDAAAWKDYGTATQRKDGRLVGEKGMVTIAEKVKAADMMVSADAGSDAEAGIILRFHDANNYVVALYSPSLKSIFIHDRKNGQWGKQLGQVAVPRIGPDIRLTAAVSGEYAALVLTDGKTTFHTPAVKISNTRSGKAGLWFYQIGERQQFDNFEVSSTQFAPAPASAPRKSKDKSISVISSGEYKAPRLPSPQDWVLVLERVKS